MENKLTPPCAYQGGKQRLAKDIVDIVFKQNNITQETNFYDLCCGSGAVSIELINRGIHPSRITMVDIGVFGEFYNIIGNGTFDLNIFKQQLDKIPTDKNLVQQHLHSINRTPLSKNYVYEFLILQSGSFGGKQISKKNDEEWEKATFCNYWMPTATSNRRYPRNPMMPMPNTLYERVSIIVEKMRGIKTYNCKIEDIIIQENSIVYIDPPYKNTSGYKHNIDILEYIKTINNCNIYISEGVKLSDESICLSKGRAKGGISGNRKKKANEEWLSIFKS